MSDGLKVIAAAIGAGSPTALLEMDQSLFVEDEIPVFDYVRTYLRQYRVLPQAATVTEETAIRLPLVREPLDFYVDQIYQRHEYEQIRERFGTLREAMSTRDMAAAHDVVADMARVGRTRHRRGREVMNIQEAGELVMARIQATRGMGGITGVTSGWDNFDEITGGYQKGDLISWVGRPSTGKTYLLLKQAEKAHLDGENVLFVTTEMGQEQIARRYASIKLGINPTLLKKNMLSTHMERRLRSMFIDMMGAERFKIFSVGMNSKVNAIEALIQEFGPTLVIIDGVYLLQPSQIQKNASKVDRVTGVYDELKALNLEAEVPMLLSSQLNRQAGKGGKDASLETIGFADAIGTHSSIVVAAKFGPTENPAHSRSLEFLKGREGESGSIAINFKFAPLDMDEFTPEQLEAEITPTAIDLDWMG